MACEFLLRLCLFDVNTWEQADWKSRSSWSKEYPFERLVQEAAVLPVFDGGNQGVRRRVVQKAMLQDDYDPFPDFEGGKPPASADTGN